MDNKKLNKDSPYGEIPSDWEVLPVGEAFEICNNLRFPISEEERAKIPGVFPYYGPTKIQDYINEYRVEGKFSIIGEDGDHFLKWKDLPMTLLIEGKFNVNNHAHLVKGKNNLTEWFFYFFNHRELTPYLTRQGAGRYKLTKEALKKIPCVIPNLTEQKKITKCISTWDRAILALQNLIDQKEQQKKWLMQRLLSGKKRLIGFDGKWSEVKVGAIANIPEKTPISEIKNLKLLTVRLHTKGIQFNPRDKPILSSSGRPYYIRNEGEILIGRQNIHNGGIGLITSEFDGHICSNAISSLGVNNKVASTTFILYYFSFQEFYERVENYMGGTGQKELSEKQLLEIPLYIPKTLEEQIAIANVLSASDKEISSLYQKRNLLKEQKRGLMQQLLTGKKRLII